MTKRDLLAVAIRILGLTFFVGVIISLPLVASIMFNSNWELVASKFMMMCCNGGYFILMGIAGVILMRCASGIARSIMPEDSKLDWPEWLCDKAVLFDFGARIYGVILLARSIPWLIGEIVERVQANNDNIQLSQSTAQSILTSVITFVIGVCLLVGIGRIAGWLRNITGQAKKMLEGPNA
ncbi:MAG: hypothetical protein NT018_06390 [Armatimonadetes bacterium]|nr:hypothetical protein [Armatimonadota bacterium]